VANTVHRNPVSLTEAERKAVGQVLRDQLRDQATADESPSARGTTPGTLHQALREIEVALSHYCAEVKEPDWRPLPRSAEKYLTGLAKELEDVADTLETLSEVETRILTIEREAPWIPPTGAELEELKDRSRKLANYIPRALADLKRIRKRPSAARYRAEEHLAARLADVWERYTIGNWTVGYRNTGAWARFVAAVFKIAVGADRTGADLARKNARERRLAAKTTTRETVPT
jgi:hypothetical protein